MIADVPVRRICGVENVADVIGSLTRPESGYGYDRTPGWNATWKAVPAWDSAYFVIPRELYTYYGNSSCSPSCTTTRTRS
jgi:hypothetical protein